MTRTFTTKKPTTIEFSLGNGLVVASTLLLENMYEWNTEGSRIFMNLLYYMLSQNSNRWLRIKASDEKFSGSETKCFPFSIKTAGLGIGEYFAEASITINNGNSPIDVIPFMLNVQSMPKLKLQTNKLNFGYLQVGSEKVMNITLSNSGQEILNSEFNITGADVFSILPDNSYINPGETKELKIRFKPTEDDQYYHSHLNISSNDPLRPEIQVKLEGNTGGINGTINQHINNLIVSPNPTDGLFVISGEQNGSDLIIELLDSQGRMIYNKVVKHTVKFHEEVDISNFPKGTYILQLCSNGNIQVYKIVLI